MGSENEVVGKPMTGHGGVKAGGANERLDGVAKLLPDGGAPAGEGPPEWGTPNLGPYSLPEGGHWVVGTLQTWMPPGHLMR